MFETPFCKVKWGGGGGMYGGKGVSFIKMVRYGFGAVVPN